MRSFRFRSSLKKSDPSADEASSSSHARKKPLVPRVPWERSCSKNVRVEENNTRLEKRMATPEMLTLAKIKVLLHRI